MSNIVAGIVRGQLPYLEEHIAQKRVIWERYKKGFEELPVSMNPYEEENSVPNFWLSCMLINKQAMAKQIRGDTQLSYIPEKAKTCPDEIFEVLDKYNVQSRPIWKPMHMQPIYKDNAFVKVEDEAVGEDIFQRGICLPSDNKMTLEEQEKVIDIVKRCFD
jgi:dTDP-4-amino-4,6-dideoxygalactose transaminase